MTAPVELVRELLYYRDMRMIDRRDWGLITAFLAGSSLALPILAPFAVGSLVALGIDKLRKLRRQRAIAGVTLPAPIPAPGATTLYGVARKFRTTVSSLIAGDPDVLLEHAMIKDRRGAVLLRRSRRRCDRINARPSRPCSARGVGACGGCWCACRRGRARRWCLPNSRVWRSGPWWSSPTARSCSPRRQTSSSGPSAPTRCVSVEQGERRADAAARVVVCSVRSLRSDRLARLRRGADVRGW
jgi:hypothetical protein